MKKKKKKSGEGLFHHATHGTQQFRSCREKSCPPALGTKKKQTKLYCAVEYWSIHYPQIDRDIVLSIAAHLKTPELVSPRTSVAMGR